MTFLSWNDWTVTFFPLVFLSKAFKTLKNQCWGFLSIPVDLFQTIQLPVYRLIIYAVTLMFTEWDERLSLSYKSLSQGLSGGYGSCQRQTYTKHHSTRCCNDSLIKRTQAYSVYSAQTCQIRHIELFLAGHNSSDHHKTDVLIRNLQSHNQRLMLRWSLMPPKMKMLSSFIHSCVALNAIGETQKIFLYTEAILRVQTTEISEAKCTGWANDNRIGIFGLDSYLHS